jgi:ADP-ribosylglycohydrolase
MMTQSDDRKARLMCSLEGLSIGDAFGERFFVHPDIADRLIESRALPASPWPFTDDTLMSLSIASMLIRRGRIDQDELALSFAERYEPSRGYGPSMNGVLARIREGGIWRDVTQGMFGGQGSYGNGAAMRIAPLGAYFADDLDTVIEQAALSAEVTHSHREAVAGAIAVAVAAALACQLGDSKTKPDNQEFLDLILPKVPFSEVQEKIRRAREMPTGTSVSFAVSVLGNGVQVSAQDTVPFALWCAAQYLEDFEEAMWLTVSGLGDRDTTCAMVGGIVSMYVGQENLPDHFRQSREDLPDWPFRQHNGE